MRRADIEGYFMALSSIEGYADRFVPITLRGTTPFRAELGGMITVSIASSYENIVKAVLIDYSSRHNAKFGWFVERNYAKLNSRIGIGDLRRYSHNAGDDVQDKFNT